MTATRKLDITAAARRHHEELFPNQASTLIVTDPELIELYHCGASDEYIQGIGEHLKPGRFAAVSVDRDALPSV